MIKKFKFLIPTLLIFSLMVPQSGFAVGSAMTKANFDQSTDDPVQAFSELATNVDLYNAVQAALTTISTLAIGDGLKDDGLGNLDIDLSTTPGLQFSSAKLEVKAGAGIQLTASGVEADINGLSAETTVDASADYVMFYDASATALKKILTKDLGTPTGSATMYVGATAPAGWVIAQGGTMGNAASSGTARANADTETLFTLLWDSMADAEAPVSTGRGASAAADYAANKTITLPDYRGRAPIGSGTGPGLTARTHGDQGGEEGHVLTGPELPTITTLGHKYGTGSTGGPVGDYPIVFSNTWTSYPSTETLVVDPIGGGNDDPHNVMQPWTALNFIIKL